MLVRFLWIREVNPFINEEGSEQWSGDSLGLQNKSGSKKEMSFKKRGSNKNQMGKKKLCRLSGSKFESEQKV